MLAKECDLNVNKSRLFDSDICSGFFGAKRSDLANGSREHMASLSSLLETTHRILNFDYNHLLQIVQMTKVICMKHTAECILMCCTGTRTSTAKILRFSKRRKRRI